MIPADADASGPFTLCAAVWDGHQRKFDTLADAVAYATKLHDRINVTSVILNRHGVMVSSNEIADGVVFDGGDVA